MSLTGKRILVTGASGALGAHMVEAFLALGGHVVAAARRKTALSEVRAQMGTSDRLALAETDVTDPAMVERLFEGLEREGALHAVVHVVGGFAGGRIVDCDDETWRRMSTLNLDSAFFVLRGAARRMRPRGDGRIVLVASTAAEAPSPGAAAYGATKAAVVHLARSTAAELVGAGVTVNVLAPGTMDTPDNRAAMPGSDPSRWVQPADVAAIAVRLCTSDGRGVTGSVLTLPTKTRSA